MNAAMPAHSRKMGAGSALTVLVLGLSYGATLVGGLLSLQSPADPIGDPWFTLLEVLIIAQAPALVVLFASIHGRAAPAHRPLALAALAFISITATLTSVLHFTILTLGRTAQYAALIRADGPLAFRWPSFAYAIDILAWDVFFALAVLSAAPAFGGDRLGLAVRWSLIAAGVLALGGLAGLPTGDMGLRNIGILGYGVVLPLAAGLMALLFRREARA